MGRTLRLTRILVGFVLLVGFAVLRVSSALAADSATVTIHKAECPTGVGSAIFDECHDNGLSDVDFQITDDAGTQVVTTDANGVASAEVVAGNVEIAEDPNDLDDYLGAYVYCSEQNSGEVLIDTDLDGGNSVFGTIDAGDDVICDWYDITPASDTGDDDGDDDTGDDTGGSTSLPSTGAGPSGSADDATLLLTLALTSLVLGGAALGLRRRPTL